MLLYIMRHADAVNGRDDPVRALSGVGCDQARQMGRWLAKLGMNPTIVSSPYIRTMETATLVGEELGGLEVIQDHRLASGMPPEDGVALVHEHGGDNGLLLVGHAPDVGSLASYFLGTRQPCVDMGKAAVICLQLERSGFGSGVLRWHLNPTLHF